ncbi:MAG: hypothetical protein JWN48_3961 [Myxococcaceae bacterium]|nr:hypothetical protein [Myxococcaceae bacterium]
MEPRLMLRDEPTKTLITLLATMTEMLIWTLLVSCLCASGRAHAEPNRARSFALIIANNRSTDAAQPDLQYADDDGARYYRLFRSIAGESDVALLTSFDRASGEQYPQLARVAHPATRSEVLAARDRIAAAIGAARARGERTEFYLVYAGHGAVESGRGLLDLEDTQIDGDFLERELLSALPADTKHLLLDSCNSFFVVNPRKPGGRRWATPKDMAFGFSARNPDVGLFLSTNSESEVFEWSELESGVFSHEVRSGLSGGADADGDGAISYVELAGFIERANQGIGRESLRPHLFYRGPRGDQNAPIFSAAAMRGRRVVLGANETRLWIKSATGERLLDVHKEAGPMTLVIPEGEQGELSFYTQDDDASAHRVITEQAAPEGVETVQLAQLSAHAPSTRARGNRLFGELFVKAYGALALAEYIASTATTPEPVFGVTQQDLDRMHSYLQQFAQEGRSHRVLAATLNLGFGALAGSAAIALGAHHHHGDNAAPLIGLAAASGFYLSLGSLAALRVSSGERALLSFETELRDGGQKGARAFAETERWLTRMETRERRRRKISFWLFESAAVAMAGSAVATLASEAHGHQEHQARALTSALMFSGAAFYAVLGAVIRGTPTASERMLDLYREDPKLKFDLGVSAGPGTFSLSFKRAF